MGSRVRVPYTPQKEIFGFTSKVDVKPFFYPHLPPYNNSNELKTTEQSYKERHAQVNKDTMNNGYWHYLFSRTTRNDRQKYVH